MHSRQGFDPGSWRSETIIPRLPPLSRGPDSTIVRTATYYTNTDTIWSYLHKFILVFVLKAYICHIVSSRRPANTRR